MVWCGCDTCKSRCKGSLRKCSLIGWTVFCACEGISCLNPLKSYICINGECHDNDDDGGDDDDNDKTLLME